MNYHVLTHTFFNKVYQTPSLLVAMLFSIAALHGENQKNLGDTHSLCVGQSKIHYIINNENLATSNRVRAPLLHDFQINLALKRFCVLDTAGAAPTIYVTQPEAAEIKKIICDKNLQKLAAKKIELINWQKLQRKTLNLKANSPANELFFILEYKHKMPIWLKLKCIHDLVQVTEYFKRHLASWPLSPTDIKPLLLITLKNTGCIGCREEAVAESCAHPHYALSQYFQLVTEESELEGFLTAYTDMLEHLNDNKINLSPSQPSWFCLCKRLLNRIKIKDVLLLIIVIKSFLFFRELRHTFQAITETAADKQFVDSMLSKLTGTPNITPEESATRSSRHHKRAFNKGKSS